MDRYTVGQALRNPETSAFKHVPSQPTEISLTPDSQRRWQQKADICVTGRCVQEHHGGMMANEHDTLGSNSYEKVKDFE